MNGHQNVAFSHLIGALKSPRNLNGYGADYAAIQEWLENNQRPNCKREMCLVVDFLPSRLFRDELDQLVAGKHIVHEAELRMRLWLLSSFVNTCLEYGISPLIYCN